MSMSDLREYKCPACGGAIEFDSKSQKMKCPYCEHCRCYDRIYGNGHGRPGRWSEYAESLSDGGTAAGSTATGSTEYAAGIRGRNMEM